MAFTPGLTDTQLRATAVPVSGSVTATISGTVTTTGGLTDTQLRASVVPVSLTSTTITGSVAVTGAFYQATQPVSLASTTITGSVAVTGPLTDTQLRASAVPVSLASTTITGTVAVSGPLTDTQLRASAVPVSLASTTITGTVAATQSGTWNIGSITTLPALAAGTNAIGSITNTGFNVTGTLPAYAATPTFNIGTAPTITVTGPLTDTQLRAAVVPVSLASTTITGTVAVNATLQAGTAIAGKFGIDQTTPGTTNLVAIGASFGAAISDTTTLRVVNATDAELNTTPALTSLRDSMVAQRYTILADSIADGMAAFWTPTIYGAGTVTVLGGEGLIQSGADATGAAQVVSTSPAYYPGQSHWLNSAIRFGDTGSAGNVRRIGVFTSSGGVPQDGFYFELNGTTLNAVSVKGGVATAVASTAWTRFATAPFTLDTNYHSFEIRWTANSAQFYVDNIVRHTASGGAAPITNTLNFPMAVQSINTSGATNRVIAVRNIGLGRFGGPPTLSDAGPLSFGKAEDVASADGDVGSPAMAVRRATPGNTSSADGDYEMLQLTGGKLWTTYQTEMPVIDLLTQILTEIRVTNTMLQVGLSVTDDPANLREDFARTLN